MSVEIQDPVYVRDLFGGAVTIIVYGAPFNWRFVGLSRDEMEAGNPGVTTAIEAVLCRHNVKRAFSPRPTFNGEVALVRELQTQAMPNFFRGKDADGVLLSVSGDAYVLGSADCVTTVLWDSATATAAGLHCGRDALIDRQKIVNGVASRSFESVIDRATDLLLQERQPLWPRLVSGEIAAFLAAGIRPEAFDHPTQMSLYASNNRRIVDQLIEYETKTGGRWKRDLVTGEWVSRPQHTPVILDPVRGNIDLFSLIRRQLDDYGVTRADDDGFDTATSVDAEGNLRLHSNRRDLTKRNLVIVRYN